MKIINIKNNINDGKKQYQNLTKNEQLKVILKENIRQYYNEKYSGRYGGYRHVDNNPLSRYVKNLVTIKNVILKKINKK